MNRSNPYKPWLILGIGAAVVVAGWYLRPEVRWYVRQLNDQKADARAAALDRLASFGSRSSIAEKQVLAMLGDRDPAVRQAALHAVRKLGWEAKIVPAQAEVLREENSALARIHACEVLAAMGPEAREAVPALIVALGDTRPDETDPVTLSLKSKKNTVRQAAMRALAAIGPAAGSAAGPVVAFLPRSDLGIQMAFGTMSAFSNSDARVTCDTLAAIGPGASAVVPDLIALFKLQPPPPSAFDENLRGLVRDNLGTLADRKREAYGRYRARLAIILGRIGSKDAVAVLRPALADPDDEIKVQAALALWRIDRTSAGEVKPILGTLAATGNLLVVHDAVAALAEINGIRVAGLPRKP